MIEVRHLYAGYDDRTILEDISIRFEPGKLTMILGPNGSGKSTLIRTMLGILRPISGQVEIDGRSLQDLDASERAGLMSAVMQMNAVPNMSVFQYVLHGRFHTLSWPRRYRKPDVEKAQKALEQMGIENLGSRSMDEISGGERQKAALAQAICQDTPILFLDEPGTWLDAGSQFELYRSARNLASRNRTVIMISHDLPAALEYGDRMIVLHEHHKVFDGTADELLKSGLIQTVFRVGIGQCIDRKKRRYFYTEN